jgi:hypothetical protein
MEVRGMKLSFTRCLLAALLFGLLPGCASTVFAYKPSAPVTGARKLPVKIAVLPLTDATEDFTRREGSNERKVPVEYNLAKAGWGPMIDALTPELWAKGLADEMTASGSFQAVRLVYSPSELTDEEYCIGGRLEKASVFVKNNVPNEFALGLDAVRRADNRKVWSTAVSRKWTPTGINYEGCGGSPQCFVDKYHADINRTMQSLFAEAIANLAATLASGSGNLPVEEGMPRGASTSPSQSLPESADETIEGILKGN